MKFDAGEEAAASFVKNKDTIIVTSTTHHFIDMVFNWYHSLDTIGLSHLVFVIALDRESLALLQQREIPCAFIDTGNLKNDTEADWIENAKKFKPKGILHLYEKYNINVIHLDTDIVFFKNFIPKLQQEAVDYDLVMCSDRRFDPYNHMRCRDKIISVNHDQASVSDWGLAEQAKFGEKNGAIMYLPVNSKERVLNYLKKCTDEEIYKKFPRGVQEGSLQTVANSQDILKETVINIKVLSVYEFPNGSLWKVPYLKNLIKDTCYLVHYNFHSHAGPENRLKEKIQAMTWHGHWYL